ncbi:hypothetical protein DEIPH_ctg069orf0012 [Deinococcus phoenicis]|uniref:RES domain-containing protein n=1 Tax=Deinococcus phoenicis TaxID=1476583 RepID=A0A016QLD6_9DEIO|nr:RES family NAD+ phosphorylase [Deinococcus phoenicis]EYB66811.1 hypothetical protein DEIPH_ctg069orf0012 [Deinococcus phoenicis]
MSQLLFPALATVPAVRPTAMLPAYRTVPLAALRKYSADPLNTAGSRITGGRYNAPEEFPEAHEMLYLAENTAVAHAEARVITVVSAPGGGVLIQPGQADLPRLDVCVHLRLKALLDLTDPQVLQALHLSPADLLREWFPLNRQGQLAPTQQLAFEARQTGRFDAVLYPSARFPGGRNYAVYPGRVAPADRALHDPAGEVQVFGQP